MIIDNIISKAVQETLSDVVADAVAKSLRSEQTQFSRMSDSEFTKYVEAQKKNYIVPIPAGKESLLTENQQNKFRLIKDEHILIAKFTPILFDICESFNRNLVNTEEEKWIHTLLKHPDNYQKPDLFSGLPLLYIKGSSHRPKLNHIRSSDPDKYLFGKGIWELRDYYILWEFKVKIGPADRGRAYSYATHISRDDKFNKYFVILADAKDFYIIEAQENITSIKQGSWIAPGSKDVIGEVLQYRNHSLYLLEQLCVQLKIQVIGYLGAGGYGRCFAVLNTEGKKMALKVVQVINQVQHAESLVKGEYNKLSFELNNVPNVIKVIPDSLTTIYQNGLLIGIGYLMNDIGIPLNCENCKSYDVLNKLLNSLKDLHINKIYHGDARYHNAILINDNIVWIDFIDGFKSDNSQNHKYFADIRLLIISIFGEDNITDELEQLLIIYSESFNNIRNIIEILPTI